MKHKKAKVNKVSFYDYDTPNDIFLLENQKIREEPILRKKTLYANEKEAEIHEEQRLSCTFFIQIGNRTFERNGILKCPPRERKIISREKKERGDFVYITYLVEREDFEFPLIQEIRKQETDFCLTESELIKEADKLIKNKYPDRNFRTQVEIDGCIADGLCFINSPDAHNNCKIIGFEAKTDKDVYFRLYNQLNAYLTICDEVYLVIENKEIPKDLPFYVGVIKIEQGEGKKIRNATSLKHDVDVKEIWSTLMKNFANHVGLSSSDKGNIINFFKEVENIKKKLIWNQFVVGFKKSWTEEYIPLTEDEKNIIKSYFGKEANKILQ